ncbi:MAG: prenyltransferase [Candidatus Omnitrophica bacterium]|nr:prenyltransferase [Candidatus Omnitrophota bacterium]
MGGTRAPAPLQWPVLAVALRLPFISASIAPFIFGACLARSGVFHSRFFLGLLAAVAVHLGANLINDYADSRSGADWQDQRFFGFFGGSKLIQHGILSEQDYLRLSCGCFAVAALAVSRLAVLMGSVLPLALAAGIALLAWSYSQPPLQLVYRCLGEPVIFLLFGPALVMGGFYVQTGLFPAADIFFLSVPVGLLVTAILFANEIPDFPEDIAAGKRTWVSLTGQRRAYILYYLLCLAAFAAIGVAVARSLLPPPALMSGIGIFFVLRAGRILRQSYQDKARCVRSAQDTIALFMVVVLILTGVVLR